MKYFLKVKPTPNEDGECPLYLRLRKTQLKGGTEESSIVTGVWVNPKFLQNGVLSTRTPNKNQIQSRIRVITNDLDRIVLELKETGLEPLPSLVKKRYLDSLRSKEEITPKIITFWKGFEEFLESKLTKSRGYYKTIITLQNLLESFEKEKRMKISFDYIVGSSVQFQNEFQKFLWVKRGLSNGYINKILDNLSQYLHYSVQVGYITKKPKFSKNDIVERDEKIYLNQSEVLKLFKSNKWNYEPQKDYSSNPHIISVRQKLEGTKKDSFGGELIVTNWELVKDVFLFMCSIGCRYSDIPYFKVHHFSFEGSDSFFTWIQQKTDKRVSVPANDVSSFIFQKYSKGKSLSQNLFPPQSNQKFNKGLKLLLKDLNFNRIVTYPKKIGSKVVNDEDRFLWELISSHSGRRSYIKNMIDLGNMDYKTIMKLSGHKTMSEFEKYISVTKEDLKKGKKLYKMDNGNQQSDIDELVQLFVGLDDEKKKLALQVVRSIQ